MRVLAKDIAGVAKQCFDEKSPGTEIEACGWVHRIRDMGGVNFVILRDRSGLAQLVLEEKPDLTLESVIKVKGLAALNEKAPGERIEIDKFVLPANLRKFIGCVCLYIWDTNRAEFDNEYKFIKKL